MLKRILFLFSLWLVLGSIQAQQFIAIPLPNQEKLPQSEIYRIFQDSEGYMWYATQGAGLCRDNGYQVDVFRSDRKQPDLLHSNVVTCIAENVGHHEIWFGTKQGGYIISMRDFSIRPIHDIVSHVKDIKQSDDGCMWVVVNKQMKVFSPKGEAIDSFALSWKGRPMGAETTTLDSHGKLWVMQWNGGIQCIDTHNRQLSTMNWEPPFTPTSLAEDTINKQYFVGTWGAGLFRYDGVTAEPIDAKLSSPMQLKVRSVHYDPWRHMLWVVTMAGLYAYDIEEDGSLKQLDTSDFGLTPQQAIYQLRFDDKGDIWVPGTTPLSFILRHTMGKWNKFVSFEELTKKMGVRVPIAAFQNEESFCWMWSDRTQLILYDLETSRFTMVNGTLGEEMTRFGSIMCKRKKGGIWCSTGKDLYVCTHQDMKVSTLKKTTFPSPISSLHESENGMLYIGTSEELFSYDETTGAVSIIAKDLRTVRDIASTPKGNVFFICLQHGLCKSNGKEGFTVVAPYNRFTCLDYSRDGHLWVGNAYGDVWRLDSALTYMPIASSRMNNGVKQIRCDSLSHVWVMGDTYLLEYHPEYQRRRLFRCMNENVKLTNFGAMTTDDAGRILVAGGGGLILFEPKPLNIVKEYLPVVAAYSIDGEKHLLSRHFAEFDIPHDAVTLELELTAFNYLKASSIQFAYRLKGLSDQWVKLPIGENRVRIVNLNKGDYTLEVKVLDSYAHWNDPVKVLTLHRLPAWYETWWAYLCYVLIVFVFIHIAIRLYLKRNKEKAQREMDTKLTEMKLRFFTNVSHELRTPLSLIITPLESIIKRNEQSKNDDEKKSQRELKSVLKHAHELLDLVNRLLDFRKMDMGEMRIHPSSGDLYDFLRLCVASFKTMADKKGIQLIADIPEGTLICDFDSKAIHHVMYNLLSNSMKYTEKGHVEVKAVHEDQTIRITVADTGSGIPPEGMPYIFDPYFQASNAQNNPHAGTGIGLSMVKEVITAMNGEVTAESEMGKGTSFVITFPIVSSGNNNDELSGNPVIPKLPSVLIADDNDDFRDFLVQELQSDYNILQARNGREALNIAQTHYVDVVLSDVMMPQMDGDELCRQLKQDEATSHIFIMLLTAKTADESMLRSYEAGADFYLTKPFSMELLRNRLQHLTMMQERRIQMLSKAESKDDPDSDDDLRISPIDRKFMEKMKATMQQHVADTTFSVDTFCADMSMSRMNFYRKMHALTGLTPAQYINDYRLNLADRLLREGELNVSEVADRTGFSTSSYFSKCYKAKFHVAPKDVRQK